MGTTMDIGTMTAVTVDLSVIISGIREPARCRVSTLPTDSEGGPSLQEGVPGGRVLPGKAEHGQLSILGQLLPFVHLPQRPAKKIEDMAAQDLR